VLLSNFVPRGFGFVHHSIAILYHEVPNPNIRIRTFSTQLQVAAAGSSSPLMMKRTSSAGDMVGRRSHFRHASLGSDMELVVGTPLKMQSSAGDVAAAMERVGNPACGF
jgi:hypothetical protein